VNIVIETDRSIVYDVGLFYVHYVSRKLMVYILQFNETINTSSGNYIATFYCPSASDAQSGRLWHLSV